MTITGNEDHSIDLETASDWTENYRNSVSTGAIIAHAFGKSDILAILNQEDCTGMRLYYALDGDGEQQIIVVGVDINGDDLYEGLLAERSIRCPPSCGATNPLNS
jgi:hypothetical protein